MTVPCSTCGAVIDPGRKFCGQCGTPVGVVCAACGTTNPSTDRFCGECGSALGGAASLPQAPVADAPAVPAAVPAAPAAERRLVSILFADLVGFTTLSEGRDPEEVRELLSRYFDICRTLITRYGGVVEKFIGDAVMAVWGAPTATEDDAERAVRAALELTAAVEALGEEAGAAGLRARAGVLTGEAAVTLGAEGQGMVAGDLVNTASRVQSVADPGAVLVGEATKRATEAAFVYQEAGTFELKGKAGLVPLWRASRVVAGVRGTLKSVGLEPPFVGRDRELRMVKDLFHASTDERTAHLVSVLGSAGIGKSRLVWEFYKYFDGLAVDTWWHRGRCLAYGEGVTYWALAEMVKMRCRIAEDEEASSAIGKLRATINEHVPDPEERRWIEPRLAHLIGLEERTAADKEDLFAAWRLFFERLTDQLPVVLAFEDMQWADSSLLDFIEYLLEWSRNYPIFVMTMARPDLTERRPTWGAGKRNFTSLYLEPLSPDAMHKLLSGLVPGLPHETQQQILERAEGVPLYAVETVRMLLDRGLLTQDGAVYRPTGRIETLEVPETLHALIAARLDGLGGEERRVVQDAAVLGKTFFKSGLASVSLIPEDELEPILTTLVRKEILSLQADPRSPERGQYGFLQDLLRTVAYETLSKRERKAKHLAAAAFLERTWIGDEDEIVEVVASHYLRAYEAAPDDDDATEIKARARDMLSKAGERAASLAAADEAQRYFERAIQLTEEPLSLAEFHERAGAAARRAGRIGEAVPHFQQAIEMFTSVGLTHPAARVSAALAEGLWQLEGRIEEAVRLMQEALDVLSGEEEDADVATLAAQLGRLLYFMGHPSEALERIELALTIAETLRLPEVLSEALNTRGLILSTHGRFEEGVVLLRHALQVALDNDLSSSALRAYNNLAAQASRQDRYQEVIDLSLRGLELARKVGDRTWEETLVIGDIGELMYLGRWDDAEVRAEDAADKELPELARMALLSLVPLRVFRGDQAGAQRVLERFPTAHVSADVQLRAVFRGQQAVVLRAEGRTEEALAAAEEAFASRAEFGIQAGHVKEALVEALEAALELGDVAKVEALLGSIEGLRPGEITPFLQAEGARFAARLAAVRHEDDRVEPAFLAAQDRFRELSMPFHVAMVQLELAEWLIARGRPDEAAPLLDDARAVFEGLRAQPWVERADAARRSFVADAGVVVESPT